MNIDRHNYEEYFILYMDNELGEAQRRQVEAFVQQHPDLKEELELLLQFKLVPDTAVVFDRKEELLMPVNGEMASSISIDLSNYEEWLVLYLDNELGPIQEKAVASFISAHPGVEKEWELLQRIRLQPEAVSFGDKSSLYRKEAAVKRITITWWRVAAAVLLFLLAGSTTVLIINNRRTNTGKEEVARTQPGQPDQQPGENISAPPVAELPVARTVATENDPPGITPVQKQPAPQQVAVIKREKTVTPIEYTAPVKKEEPVIADNTNNKPSNNLPQPLRTTEPVTDLNPSTAVAKNDIPKEHLVPNKPLTADAVTTASAQPSNFGDGNDDAPAGKKSKLRGIFRKVTRTFEKRTNTDATDEDDRLLVGGLAFKRN